MKNELKTSRLIAPLGYVGFMLLSLVLMPTSWLFQYTPFNDIGTMFAMADSMRHGLVPFQDLFEQRGPIMYLLHIIALQLAPTTPIHGIYLVELANFAVCYYFLYKIAALRWSNELIKSGLALGALILLTQSFTYNYGASPEEFCLAPNLYALYLLCRYFKRTSNYFTLTKLESFGLGLGIGWQLLIKYSNLNITGAVAILAFISTLCLKQAWSKRFKAAGSLISYAILGAIVMFIPWLIYFGLHHAIGDFFYQYFIANLGVSHRSKLFLLWLIVKLSFIAILLSSQLIAFWFAPVIFGFKALSKPKRWSFIFTVLWCLFCVAMIVRFGTSYDLPYVALLLGFSVYGSADVVFALKTSRRGYIRSLVYDIPLVALVLLFLNPIALVKPTKTDVIFMPNMLKLTLNGQSAHLQDLSTDSGFRLGTFLKRHGYNQNILIYNGIPNSIYENAQSYPKLKYFDQTTIPYVSQKVAGDSQIKYIQDKTPSAVVMPAYQYQRLDHQPFTIDMLNQLRAEVNRHAVDSNSSAISVSKLSAAVTAVAERIKVHPNDYTNKTYLKYQNGFYNTVMPMPKALLKNYKLAYIDSDPTQVVKYKTFSTTFGYAIWIPK